MAQAKTPPQGKHKKPGKMDAHAGDVKVWGPVYVCPEIIRDPQAVSDAELKAWALAIIELIKAGMLGYKWATMARVMQMEGVVFKLGSVQQSLGLLHACGRLGLDVFQRKCEEQAALRKGARIVYYVVRRDLSDQGPLGRVYGAGTIAARKLLKEGSVQVTDYRLRRRIEMATRKLLPRENPEVYEEFCRFEGKRKRHRVLFVEEDKATGGYILRIDDRLKGLMDKQQRKNVEDGE